MSKVKCFGEAFSHFGDRAVSRFWGMGCLSGVPAKFSGTDHGKPGGVGK